MDEKGDLNLYDENPNPLNPSKSQILGTLSNIKISSVNDIELSDDDAAEKVDKEQLKVFELQPAKSELPEEKRKVKKRVVDILGRKKQKKKVISAEEGLLRNLLKAKKKIGKDRTLFNAKLEELQGEVPKSQQEFYYNLYNITVDVKKLSIAKNLVKSPIVIPLYDVFQTKTLTSDMLYWGYNLKKFGSFPFTKYLNKIKKIYLCSFYPIVFDYELKTNEYYVEDFNRNISAPGWTKKRTIWEESGRVVDSFNLFGNRYIVIEPKNNAKIYFLHNQEGDELTEDERKNIIKTLDESVYIYKKGKLYEGMRELKLKGSYYFSGVVVPTLFCPDNIILIEEYSFGTLYFMEMDADMFVNDLKISKKMNKISNIIYWDNMLSGFELIGVLLLTTNVFDNDELCTNAFMIYNENRRIFTFYKAHFKLFERIVLGFLDSFHKKVNIDKMRELYQDAENFLLEHDNLLSFEKEYLIVDQVVTSLMPMTEMMYNFLHREPNVYISLISKTCSLVLNINTNVNDLEIYLRSTALKLHEVLYNGKCRMIMTIRSPNSFLLNTIGDYDVNKLKDYVYEIREKISQRNKQLETGTNEKIKLLKAGADIALRQMKILNQEKKNKKNDDEIIKLDLDNIKVSVVDKNKDKVQTKMDEVFYSINSNMSNVKDINERPVISNQPPLISNQPVINEDSVFYRQAGGFPITGAQLIDMYNVQNPLTGSVIRDLETIQGKKYTMEDIGKIGKDDIDKSIRQEIDIDEIIENVPAASQKKIFKFPKTKGFLEQKMKYDAKRAERLSKDKKRQQDMLPSMMKKKRKPRGKTSFGKIKGSKANLYKSQIVSPINEIPGYEDSDENMD